MSATNLVYDAIGKIARFYNKLGWYTEDELEREVTLPAYFDIAKLFQVFGWLIAVYLLLPHAAATVTTYNYDDGVSGRIQKLGLTYTSSIHWGNMTIQSNPLLGQTKRVYYHIDTSDIPTDAIIDLIEMRYQVALSQPITQCLATESYIGSWIGTSLDGTAADFNGGNQLFNDIFVYGANTWFDMGLGGVDARPYVNKGGTTDVRIDCVQTDNSNRQYIFEKSNAKTQFRITWHLPDAANVSLTNPVNATWGLVNETVNYQCNASEEVNVKNLTFYFQNEWQTWAANYTNTTEGLGINNTVSFVNLSAGNYTWNCQACINNGSCYFSQYNYTHETRPNLRLGVEFIPPTPSNNTVISENFSFVNVSTGKEPQACTLYWKGSPAIDTPNYWTGYSSSAVVSAIRTSDGNAFANVSLTGTAIGEAVDSRSHLWTVNTRGFPPSNLLTEVDESGNLLNDYSMPERMYGVAVDYNNTLWVSSYNGELVYQFDPNTGSEMQSITVRQLPRGLTSDANNKIWVTNAFDNLVTEIDPTTSQAIKNVTVPSTSFFITPDGSGNLWVVINDVTNAIYAVSKINSATGEVTLNITRPDATAGITVDTEGYVWITQTAQPIASKINPTTGALILNMTIAGTGEGISADSNGFVWASIQGAGIISKIRASDGEVVINTTINNGAISNGDSTGHSLNYVLSTSFNAFPMTIVPIGGNSFAYYNKTGLINGVQNYYYVVCNDSLGTVNQSETRWVEFILPTVATTGGGNPTPSFIIPTPFIGEDVKLSKPPIEGIAILLGSAALVAGLTIRG